MKGLTCLNLAALACLSLLAAACGGTSGDSDCTPDSCPQGMICDEDSGRCEEPAVDLCASVTCAPGQTCDPQTGQCAGDAPDPCDGVTCDPGQRCEDGACVPTDAPDPCDGVTCDAPPAPTCDGLVAVTYADSGACMNGDCDYPAQMTDCGASAQLCEAGQCVAPSDPCEGVVCAPAPAPYCDGLVAVRPDPTFCADGVCQDPVEMQDCDPLTEICEDGFCIPLDPQGFCGDGVCSIDNEDCSTCPADCDPCQEATLRAQVRLARDANSQVDELYRSYLTAGSQMARGVLYLQLCEDAACERVALTRQARDEYLYSTGFPTDIEVTGLPVGQWWARFFLDTQYSRGYEGDFDTWGGPSPMDLLQSQGDDPRPRAGFNPPAGATSLVLSADSPAQMGLAVLGTFVPSRPAFAPAAEPGHLLLTAEDEEGRYRNQIRVLDTDAWQITQAATATLGGDAFEGDLCGFVPHNDRLYALGVGEQGAYVYAYDTDARAFVDQPPVWIPHPECEGDQCPARLSAQLYPFPCRGVAVERQGRTFLYLIEFKGAGALTSTQAYQLTVVDVTDLEQGGGQVVQRLEAGAHPFITTRRIFRGLAAHEGNLYLIEPSWSEQLINESRDSGVPPTNQLHVLPINADGTLDLDARTAWSTRGTANDTCGSTNNWVPGLALARVNGQPRLFVGNDTHITVFEPGGAFLGELDTQDYGTLVTSFAASPTGDRLYAMPNCKSSRDRASVQLGIGERRTNLDRHAALVMDLGAPANVPPLLDTDRDFDLDGDADGGVDLEFLYLKRDLLRWCDTCTGVVPPTSYTGPAIAAGSRSLFLRGSAVLGSTGLGQVGDVGVYDLSRGQGVIFRDHSLWLDGPSARWGLDINPANPSREPTEDDISVSAFHFLPAAR